MSWDDHARRRAAITSVLTYAERHPGAGLPYEQLPDVCAEFADRRELVLALQYVWAQALWARIELLSAGGGRSRRRRRGPSVFADARALARLAWDDCAARQPVLRRLLDGCREELGLPV